MAYRLEIAPAARREIKKLARDMQGRILEAIERLSEQPRPLGVKKLQTKKDLYRVRIGVYRIVYRVDERELLIRVDRVRHRREAYRDL